MSRSPLHRRPISQPAGSRTITYPVDQPILEASSRAPPDNSCSPFPQDEDSSSKPVQFAIPGTPGEHPSDVAPEINVEAVFPVSTEAVAARQDPSTVESVFFHDDSKLPYPQYGIESQVAPSISDHLTDVAALPETPEITGSDPSAPPGEFEPSVEQSSGPENISVSFMRRIRSLIEQQSQTNLQ